MAGICGQVGLVPTAFDEAAVDRMAQKMSHRGGRVAHARWREVHFAAVSHDAPPIWPGRGRESPRELCVVIDGTIDNTRDLAIELSRDGLPTSANAAELLASGFKEQGPEFLKRLRGPFAAAVHDPEKQTTWLVRDPMGMRPLYLSRTRSRILFASEIRALLADPTLRPELDQEQLRVLLTLGFNPAPHTLLKGIHKMPPGHLVEITSAGPKSIQYDQPVIGSELDIPFDEAVEGYRTMLRRVIRRSGTDKTGIFLSGGADSSALLLLWTREGNQASSYTAGFPELTEEEDERAHAWQAASALGTLHQEKLIEIDEIGSLLQSVAKIVEEPTAAAWMPTFSRLLDVPAGQVSTLWTGQGAGAIHGEGDQWRWLQWGEMVAGLPERVGGFVGGVADRVSRLSPSYKKTRLLGEREEGERVLGSFFLFDDRELDRLLRPGQSGDRQTVRKLLERWRKPVEDLDPLAQGLFMYSRTFLPDGVFLPAGRLAAEKGISVRFPYADRELVQWLERLPSNYRIEGETGKRLHREALGAWLPLEVLARPKTDFGYAVRRWIREKGKEKVEEWLLGSNAWVPSILDGVRVRSVIDRACQNRGPMEPLILLIHLELWARVTFLGEIR